ncbi:MAG: RHS repeat protein, partial [Methanoregula sp.]|nr:RHS repeat protein [Methanoregula sp.]
MNDDETIILYTYDALDRLISVTYPDRSEVTYSYDPTGNIVSVSVHSPENDEKQPAAGSNV